MDAFKTSLTPLYVTAAVTLALISFLATVRLLTGGIPSARVTRLIVLAGFALGPASILDELTRPAVFEEAIAWGTGFACFATFAFLKWWRERRLRWLGLLVVALVLGANARPTVIPMAIVIGIAVLVRVGLEVRRHVALRFELLLASMVPSLPVITSLGVYWLKFRQLVPNQDLNTYPGVGQSAYRASILAQNGQHFIGLEFCRHRFLRTCDRTPCHSLEYSPSSISSSRTSLPSNTSG